MGTIAARDCRRVATLTQQVMASALLASAHGSQLRLSQQQPLSLAPEVVTFIQKLIADHPLLTVDRTLESELRQLLKQIEARYWSLYSTADVKEG